MVIAIGTTLVVGTIIPPFMHGQFLFLFESRSGLVTLAGILVAGDGSGMVNVVNRSPGALHLILDVNGYFK